MQSMREHLLNTLSRRCGKPSTILTAITVTAMTLGGCDNAPAQKSDDTSTANRPVLVENVHYAPLTASRTFVATIKPRTEADLGFRVGGKVMKRLVDVGAQVKPGDVLAILDETDLNLQLEQAQAEVRAATGNMTNADTELQRRSALAKQGFTTQVALDQQRTVVDEARSRLTKGERALQLAQNALGYSKLIADADGMVTAALVEPGQVVAAGQVVARVARTNELEALAAIPEALVDRVRTGKASVALWSNPEKKYRAELRELSPAADAATRTYAARFSLPDAGREFAWGMTATITVSDTGVAEVARLPLSALFNQGTGTAFWTVDRATGTLTLKPVEVVRYDGTSVFVGRGLAEGDDVVVLGVQKLDAGQKVRVVTTIGS